MYERTPVLRISAACSGSWAMIASACSSRSLTSWGAPKRIAALQEEIKSLKKKLQSGAGAKVDAASAAAKLLAEAPVIGSGKLIVGEISGASDEQLAHQPVESVVPGEPEHELEHDQVGFGG